MKRNLFLICIFFATLSLSAQTAAELDTLLETENVSIATAARFTMGSVGLLPAELSGAAAEASAYEEALSRGWVRRGPDDAISLQNTAFLIMNAFELRGGIMYSLFHNPRYAYREMLYRKLIQGRANSSMKVPGRRFLQILGRALNYAGEREEMDALLLNLRGGLN